jgi:hypothetical protein
MARRGREEPASPASPLAAACTSVEERLAYAFRKSGPSITLTTITDMLAFAVGSTIDLPAVRDFCLAASFSVAGVFLLQFTFFAGCLALDERRLLEGGLDCCLPQSCGEEREEEEAEAEEEPRLGEQVGSLGLHGCPHGLDSGAPINATSSATSSDTSSDTSSATSSGLDSDAAGFQAAAAAGGVSPWIMKTCFTHRPTQILVLGIFIAASCFGGYAVTQVGTTAHQTLPLPLTPSLIGLGGKRA